MGWAMRSRRSVAAATVAIAVLACAGCSPAQQAALKQEAAREGYVQSFGGPMHVASAVAAVAPGGGPAPLRALCADQAWRSLAARALEVPGPGPSPFDVPDPNRPVQVRKRGSTIKIIIR
jgi:hypothetical protein